jgi:hypothetical protein
MTTTRKEREALLEKAIELRLLERWYSLEENRYVTGFVPRFHEAMMKHLNEMKEQERFDWFEMAKTIGEYWVDISDYDGAERLRDMAKNNLPAFREMCDLLLRRRYRGSGI